MTDLTDKMAEAYWNAYREGYYASGGKLDYPLWTASTDPVRNETYRCMRYAADVLMNALIATITDPDVDDVSAAINALFPLPPMTRDEAVEFMSANNKQLLDVMRDANN